MKTKLYWLCLLAISPALVRADGDQKAKKDIKNPMSKMFVASSKGDSMLNEGSHVQELGKTSAFSPDNSTIETKDKSHNSMVYSNGTGIYVDENTKMVVKSFEQEPFNTTRDDVESEPSISQTDAYVSNGLVGICSPKMSAGSSMVYGTAHGSAQIRGRQVAIRADENKTTIYSFEGEVTVRAGNRDLGGQILNAGEQAVIQPGAPGQPNTVSISRMNQSTYDQVNEKVSSACQAKKTVVWDTVEQKPRVIGQNDNSATGGGGDKSASGNASAGGNGSTSGVGGGSGTGNDGSTKEIVPTPVVTVTPPITVEVSPSRIR